MRDTERFKPQNKSTSFVLYNSISTFILILTFTSPEVMIVRERVRERERNFERDQGIQVRKA